jgi:hypothetical protein
MALQARQAVELGSDEEGRPSRSASASEHSDGDRVAARTRQQGGGARARERKRGSASGDTERSSADSDDELDHAGQGASR